MNPPLSLPNGEIENGPTLLQGESFKLIISSNIIAFWTKLAVLLGLKSNGHTDTLTESSNLKDERNDRDEIQNEQQYRNASDRSKSFRSF